MRSSSQNSRSPDLPVKSRSHEVARIRHRSFCDSGCGLAAPDAGLPKLGAAGRPSYVRVMRDLALCIFVAVTAARLGLSWLNLRHLEREGHRVPSLLAREVDAEKLGKISRYTAERARFGLVHRVASSLVMGGFLFAGGLGRYDAWVTGLHFGFVWSG